MQVQVPGGLRSDAIRLDQYTVTGVAGWGVSVWTATSLGIVHGGLWGGWIAGSLVYLVLVREWRRLDCRERVQRCITVTILTGMGVVAAEPLLLFLGLPVPALLEHCPLPFVLGHLPVVTAATGALQPGNPVTGSRRDK